MVHYSWGCYENQVNHKQRFLPGGESASQKKGRRQQVLKILDKQSLGPLQMPLTWATEDYNIIALRIDYYEAVDAIRTATVGGDTGSQHCGVTF